MFVFRSIHAALLLCILGMGPMLGRSVPAVSHSSTTAYASIMAADDVPRYTAPTPNGAFRSSTTQHVAYTTISTGGGIMRVPVTSTPAPTAAASHSSSRTLVIVLPTTLLVACGLLIGLFLLRRRSSRIAARRRANSWAARLQWVPDQKSGDPAKESEQVEELQNPPPLSPLPASHQRQKSIA